MNIGVVNSIGGGAGVLGASAVQRSDVQRPNTLGITMRSISKSMIGGALIGALLGAIPVVPPSILGGAIIGGIFGGGLGLISGKSKAARALDEYKIELMLLQS